MRLPNMSSGPLTALNGPLQRRLARLLYPPHTQPDDFLWPRGEAALLPMDSVSWRVFSNPIALLLGGVAAVLLELAEPRVRSGVWEHTSFRTQPLLRLQRTGYAAMMTVFGARSRTEAMIQRINAAHGRIRGVTPAGDFYRADDVELLTWVQATASFGFVQAYAACVDPLSADERNLFYSENQAAARLYGVQSPPVSEADFYALLERMRPRLEPSPVVMEFLDIMRTMPLLPAPLRPVQSLLVKAAVQLLPADILRLLGLADSRWRLAAWQWRLVRAFGRGADQLDLATLPIHLARARLAMNSRD